MPLVHIGKSWIEKIIEEGKFICTLTFRYLEFNFGQKRAKSLKSDNLGTNFIASFQPLSNASYSWDCLTRMPLVGQNYASSPLCNTKVSCTQERLKMVHVLPCLECSSSIWDLKARFYQMASPQL